MTNHNNYRTESGSHGSYVQFTLTWIYAVLV